MSGTFVNATFTGATTGANLSAYTPETGGSFSQVTGNGYGGSFLTSSAGRAYCVSSGNFAVYTASATPTSPDYDLQADFVCLTNIGEVGIVARWDSASRTGYVLQHRKFYGFRLMAPGGGLLGDFGNEMSDGQTATIKLELRGSTLKVYKNGVQIGSPVTNTGLGEAGLVGLYSYSACSDSTGIHLDNFSATVVPAPRLVVTGTGAVATGDTYDFGAVNAGASPTRAYTLKNDGSADLVLGTLSVTGAKISISGTNPSGGTLVPDASATVTVLADASVVGSLSGSLTVPSNDAASPFVINFTGAVVTPTAPSAPSGLSASAVSSTSVALSWVDNSTNETGFIVERSADGSSGWTILATTGPNTTAFIDTTIGAASTRHYRVRATNDVGDSGNTSVAQVTTPAAGSPLAATGVTPTVCCDTRVNISWDHPDSGDPATSVVVRRQDGGTGPFNIVKTLDPRENIWTDRSCWPGSAYAYKVGRVNASGETESVPVSVTTPANQGSLSSLSGVAVTATDPWTATLSWSGASSVVWVERSADGGVTYKVVAYLSVETSWADRYLVPATTYKYRLRTANYGNRSAYSAPVSVTLPARPAGVPIEATGLSAVATGPTTSLLTWYDPNGGGVVYKVERAAVTAYSEPSYTQIGTVTSAVAGSVSYTDSACVAYTLYRYRIRPNNLSGNGGYSVVATGTDYSQDQNVCTPRVADQGGRVYEIGPGKAYTSFASFSPQNGGPGWDNLAPGDTVYVYCKYDGSGNVVPYYERLMLTCRGLPGRLIRIVAVPDPVTGQRPIIHGDGATTSPEFVVGYQPYETLGVVFIGPHVTSGPGRPGYLQVENFEIRGGTGQFFGYGGTSFNYAPASGFYLTWCDHVTLRNCYVNGVGANGLFGKSYSDNVRYISDLTVEYCRFGQNGKANSYLEHNTYIEGIRTTIQFCRYDPLKALSGGNSGIKDRGVNSVHRFNYVSGQGHYLSFVDGQDSAGLHALDSDEGGAFAYGNVLYSQLGTGTQASDYSNYGGDQGDLMSERKGVLRWYNNTMIQNGNSFKLLMINQSSNWSSVDVRNCIWWQTGGTELDLINPAGIGYYGTNWFSSTWKTNNAYGPDLTGKAHGAAARTINNGATNAPGFVDPASDFRLLVGADAAGRGAALPVSWPTVSALYRNIARGGPRSSVADLGAQSLAPASDSVAPVLSGLAAPAQGTTITGALSEGCLPLSGTGGFTLSGTARMVESWSISGASITLKLTGPLATGASVQVAHTALANGISDLAGNPLAGFSSTAVDNQSTYVPDTTAPTIPGSLTVSAVGIRSVSFAWSPSTDAVGVFSYRLYRNGTQVAAVTAPATSFTLTDVTPNVSRTYTLTAVDAAGNESGNSNSVSATALPDVPVAPAAPAAASPLQSVVISWSPVARALGYKVYRNGTLVGTVEAPGTSYTDVGPAGVYSYTLAASGADGDSSTSAGASGGSSGGGPNRPILVGG